MSLTWQDPESRAKAKPEKELPLFAEQSFCQFEQAKFAGEGFRELDNSAGCTRDRAVVTSPAIQFEQARARRNDPPHSHAAAKSVVNLGPVRDGILWLLELHGPLTDEQIADRWHPAFPEVSPSGLRSRRSELVRMGFVVGCGTGKTAAKRNCSIWRLK